MIRPFVGVVLVCGLLGSVDCGGTEAGTRPPGVNTLGRSSPEGDWLVYASDGAVVDVIADVPSHHFPGLKFAQVVQQLSGFGSTGFGGPYFQCLGASSAHSGEDLIFIVDSASDKIYEYGFGGTQPLAVRDLSPYSSDFETGCASDSTTQNVALAEVYSATQGELGVLVFAGGLNGTPEFYADQLHTSNPLIMPPAYDGASNLFFEDNGPTSVSELPAGQHSIVHLSGLTSQAFCSGGVSYLGGGVLGFRGCVGPPSSLTTEILPAKVVGSSLQQVGSPIVLSQGAINGVQCNNLPSVDLIQWSFFESHSPHRVFILGSNVYCRPAPLDVWDFSTGKYLGHFPILANSTYGSSAAFRPKGY
jgi:hypothetical protein